MSAASRPSAGGERIALERRQQGSLIRWGALAFGVAALLVAARGVALRNTWYLASDQFAFLTFAADLAHGHVLHDPSTLEILVPRPNPERTYDALSQTYFWRGGAMFSRYPPGFPALLAAAGLVGGAAAQHALNPALYLTILALLGWLTWVLLRRSDRTLAAGAGVAAMWLLLLLPTGVHLWGITVARDLPAHLLALLALLAAVGRRHVACGLALGLACTIRPDAVLYGASLAAIFWLDGVRLRPLALGGLAFLGGVLPLLAYNTWTQGHPFAFTQAGEFKDLLAELLTPGAALAQPISVDSGGAFRLANLRHTLPGNVAQLGRAFGGSALLTLVGAAWALRARRPMAAALLPYPLVAVPFYGCWSHPDARYLAGVTLCLIPLTAVGAAVACRFLADRRRSGVWRWPVLAAALLVVATAAQRLPGVGTAAVALAAAIAAAGLLASLPRIGVLLRRFAPLAPALALVAAVLLRLAGSSGTRDPFQAVQAARARETLRALLPPDAAVLTSESLGRPAENIAHYAGVPSFYLSELPLLRTDHQKAAILLAMAGRRAFFLLDEQQAATIAPLRNVGGLRVVGRRRGDAVLDWFVDPRRAADGVVLYEFVLSAEQRQLLRDFKGHVEGEL